MDSKRAMSDEKASNTWREAYKAYCAGVSHNKFGNTQAAATVIQSAFAEELAGIEAERDAEITALRDRLEKAEGALRDFEQRVEGAAKWTHNAQEWQSEDSWIDGLTVWDWLFSEARAYFAAQEPTP